MSTTSMTNIVINALIHLWRFIAFCLQKSQLAFIFVTMSHAHWLTTKENIMEKYFIKGELQSIQG